VTWSFPPLAARSSGEILVTVQVSQGAPESLLNVATITMASDGNPANNRAEATMRVVTVPAPQADFKLRIHSDLDPQQGIYTSSGTAVKWPANEVMDFLPAISLQPAAQPGNGAYRVSHRIVAGASRNSAAHRSASRTSASPAPSRRALTWRRSAGTG
jgi:hypothetical protein